MDCRVDHSLIIASAYIHGIQRVSHLVVGVLILVLNLFIIVLLHGFLQLVLVHAFVSIHVVGRRVFANLKLLEQFWLYLLSESLLVMFGSLEIQATNEILTLKVSHFFFYFD
jgi:hypothetical protein